MDVLPAIDIRGGRVVRLIQGDAGRETVYGDDPLAQAETFMSAGARWIHVVDLDRALGQGDNLPVIRSISAAAAGRARLQCGGGFRSLEAAGDALGAGVERVVLGTAAVTNPALVRQLLDEYGPERVAVGLDAREGRLAIRGWTEQSPLRIQDVAGRVLGEGVRTIVYTDIERDGMLSGPDIAGCRTLAALGASVIASGGFGEPAHLRAALDAGCAGAILGRSLYEGTMVLTEALAMARRPERG